MLLNSSRRSDHSGENVEGDYGAALSTVAAHTGIEGGAVAQSVERGTPGEEVPGSIRAVAARSLLVGSVSV